MIDIKFIRENSEYVKEALKKRGVDFDGKEVLEIDEKRREKMKEVESLRAEQNKISDEIAKAEKDERQDKIAKGKELKEKIQALEEQLRETEGMFSSIMAQYPNVPFEEVQAGGEAENRVIRKWGEPASFDFEVKDHIAIGEDLGIIDIERAGKVSGSRFGYLTGDAALLEFALVDFIMKTAIKEGFTPVVPPVFVKAETMQKMGYVDTPEDLAERYFFEKDRLFLVGTAEQSVGPMHADEIFAEKDLPRRYIAFSTCFREEAGSHGKDTRGILRVHQFDKVELFSYSVPEKSKEEHQFLIQLEEKLWQALGIPYQVLQLAAGDMSRPAASTVDIEAWLPGQNKYREVSSASNTTDYQARRLNIRYRSSEGKTELVHMLNATGFPIGRTIIAILENYQQKDGSVKIPEILQGYLGKSEIKKK